MYKSISRRGTVNSYYDVNLEDLLKDTNLPFSVLPKEEKEIYYEDFDSVVEARKFRFDRDHKTGEMEPINEASKAELIKDAEKKRKERSTHLRVYYQGVMNTKGWIRFKTTSQYTPGKFYTQYIRLDESKNFKDFKEFKKRDIVRLFMFGDISVHCNCPDYKFRGYKYMGKQMGYGIFAENRFPKIRNPKLIGTVCKHLIAVLGVFGNNWSSIARDMIKTKYWKKRYEP